MCRCKNRHMRGSINGGAWKPCVGSRVLFSALTVLSHSANTECFLFLPSFLLFFALSYCEGYFL